MFKLGTSSFYFLFFSTVVGAFLLLFFSSASPENLILGKWKEISWEYEKVENSDAKNSENNSLSKTITENVKREIIENLIIHEAEEWEFTPDGELILKTLDGPIQKLTWKLKGRGHILKLYHQNKQIEFYNLYEIGKDEMVLYFDCDIRAKGIVKMTFKKLNNNKS